MATLVSAKDILDAVEDHHPSCDEQPQSDLSELDRHRLRQSPSLSILLQEEKTTAAHNLPTVASRQATTVDANQGQRQNFLRSLARRHPDQQTQATLGAAAQKHHNVAVVDAPGDEENATEAVIMDKKTTEPTTNISSNSFFSSTMMPSFLVRYLSPPTMSHHSASSFSSSSSASPSSTSSFSYSSQQQQLTRSLARGGVGRRVSSTSSSSSQGSSSSSPSGQLPDPQYINRSKLPSSPLLLASRLSLPNEILFEDEEEEEEDNDDKEKISTTSEKVDINGREDKNIADENREAERQLQAPDDEEEDLYGGRGPDPPEAWSYLSPFTTTMLPHTNDFLDKVQQKTRLQQNASLDPPASNKVDAPVDLNVDADEQEQERHSEENTQEQSWHGAVPSWSTTPETSKDEELGFRRVSTDRDGGCVDGESGRQVPIWNLWPSFQHVWPSPTAGVSGALDQASSPELTHGSVHGPSRTTSLDGMEPVEVALDESVFSRTKSLGWWGRAGRSGSRPVSNPRVSMDEGHDNGTTQHELVLAGIPHEAPLCTQEESIAKPPMHNRQHNQSQRTSGTEVVMWMETDHRRGLRLILGSMTLVMLIAALVVLVWS